MKRNEKKKNKKKIKDIPGGKLTQMNKQTGNTHKGKEEAEEGLQEENKKEISESREGRKNKDL